MNATANPAFTAFLEALRTEMIFCQIWISRTSGGFVVRHLDDRALPLESLRLLGAGDVRALAQFTAAGVFRPLKSAPNLSRGWQAELRSDDELWLALNALYPGAVADWFAAQSAHPPITSYREFTARQTGMYRITASLPDEPARAAVAACCHPDFCWKRRLWSAEGLPPDEAEKKSVIPCLEPCAVMLEFARKVARFEQGVHPTETAPPPEGPVAECDFDSPDNPRRRRFILEKQRRAATSPA
jgi:hypothetical protein